MPGPHTPLPQTLCGPYHLGPALSRDVPGVRYAEVHCNQTPQTQSGHLQLRAWRGPGRPRRTEHLAGDPLIRLISTGFSFFLAVVLATWHVGYFDQTHSPCLGNGESSRPVEWVHFPGPPGKSSAALRCGCLHDCYLVTFFFLQNLGDRWVLQLSVFKIQKSNTMYSPSMT